MATGKEDTSTTKKQKREMGRREKILYSVLLVLLVVAIVCVSIFLLIPKLAGRPDWHVLMFFDLDDHEWIEEMADNRIDPINKAVEISSSFTYSEDTAYITSTYASTTALSEIKAYYLQQIPGAADLDEDQVARMKIVGTMAGENYDVVNYEADVLNAVDMKVTINKDTAEQIRQKVIDAFPGEVVASVPELAPVLKSSKLGGSVLYNDDELSSRSYPGIPIFSEAYRFSQTQADLVLILKDISEHYPDSVYLEEVDTVYFKKDGYVFSLSMTQSDMNILAVVTVQKIPQG